MKPNVTKHRVLFCWSDISGYMATCWRELGRNQHIALHVTAYADSAATAFSHDVMAGISWTPLSAEDRRDGRKIASLVSKFNPDVIVLAGWLNREYRRLTTSKELNGVRFVLGMDTPYRGDLRQRVAKLALSRYLDRMSMVVVPGERSWQYARELGVEEARIARGIYGVDHRTLSLLYDERRSGPWPCRFLFAGRYVADKGLDTLIEAYGSYRERVENPWELVCCGKGPMGTALIKQPGISDRGFVQPSEMLKILSSAGAFVMPSWYDPWPLAVVEACAAGLPIIASNACGSAVECVRSGVSGYTFPAGDVAWLRSRLEALHMNRARLPEMGEQSLWLSRPYSSENWARKWLEIVGLPTV